MMSKGARIIVAVAAMLCSAQSPPKPSSEQSAADEQIRVAFDSGDYKTAFQLLQPRAKAGEARAQIAFGRLYMDGLGVPSNPIEASKWFRAAADVGDARGQYLMGRMYREGIGVKEDEFEALRYLELAARQGHGEAQFLLGNLLSPGAFEDSSRITTLTSRRVQRSAVASAYWYKQAADQGIPEAQHNLALAYSEGVGVPKNSVESVRLYRVAAKSGLSSAQNNLGSAYERGEGVVKSTMKSFIWYTIAASSGDEVSLQNRNRVGEQLTAAQREQGEKSAAECVVARFVGCE